MTSPRHQPQSILKTDSKYDENETVHSQSLLCGLILCAAVFGFVTQCCGQESTLSSVICAEIHNFRFQFVSFGINFHVILYNSKQYQQLNTPLKGAQMAISTTSARKIFEKSAGDISDQQDLIRNWMIIDLVISRDFLFIAFHQQLF